MINAVRFFSDLLTGVPLDGVDLAFGWLGCALVVVVVGSVVVELTSTRVRLLDDVVEIRQWTTKRYAYNSIADAAIDRGSNDRVIRLRFRDGRSRILPAPTRGLRKPSDPTLRDAVDAIRERAGLPPAGPPLP